jgi:hypothetical protein
VGFARLCWQVMRGVGRHEEPHDRTCAEVTRLPAVEMIALYGLALLAGAMDATVGAGGLIQIPALLVLVPEAEVAAILGTHKFASSVGTAAAVHQSAALDESHSTPRFWSLWSQQWLVPF